MKKIAQYLNGMEEKEGEILCLKSENKLLRDENMRLKLDSVKEMILQLPETKETFRSWLHSDDEEEDEGEHFQEQNY